jgi:hypothetical protein
MIYDKKYMIKLKLPIRIIICLGLLFNISGVLAQSNTSSPYSQYGLGELRGEHLPQLRSLGGISTGIRGLGSYFNINSSNPASYSGIRLMAIDIGVYGNLSTQKRDNIKQNNSDFSLGYLSFAVPVTATSALSFGLLPYSDLGYRYSSPSTVNNIDVNHVYSGEGGISKGYLGYGMQLGKKFSIGANAGYLFGKLDNSQEVQFPVNAGALNSKIENSRTITGFTFDYGLQYFTNIGEDHGLVIGYSGNAGKSIRSKETEVAIRTFGNESVTEENIALDTIMFVQNSPKDVIMPMEHKVGFSLSKRNKWLVGADFHYGQWSDFKEGDIISGLENSYGVAVGANITPDYTSNKYLNLIDYRFGFRYDKTNLKINNQNINDMAVTVGLGIPLASNRQATFYKINFSAELGQRGSLENSLVKEQYVTFRLGFTLNDRWFQRYQYD